MKAKKYFSYLIAGLVIFSITFSKEAFADVCINDQQAVDVITLLDGSERDLQRIGSCETLVADLYKEIQVRDQKITLLTHQLIDAKQDAIKYRASAEKWKKVAWYSTAGGIIVVIVTVVPKFLL